MTDTDIDARRTMMTELEARSFKESVKGNTELTRRNALMIAIHHGFGKDEKFSVEEAIRKAKLIFEWETIAAVPVLAPGAKLHSVN